jgi:ABC-2 type transport system ATP-binding protein
MAVPIIQLVDLTKKYGDFTAVNSLNLTIEKGEIFGLLGPNGAGKSTTILMMLGLTEPTSGRVEVCGINSATNPIEVKMKVGYLPEDVGFYDEMTGFENLIYTARLNGIPENEARTKAEVLLNRVGLAGEFNKKTGKYSKGMRQRLGLADVLIKSPEVIILDEPTSGIDPKGVQEFLKLIVELRNEHGINVLFSSHNLHQVQQVCDRVGIFVEGRLLAVGDIESLSRELFTHGRYLIEVGIDNTAELETKKPNEILTGLLKSINGIESVKLKNGIYEIECKHDISGEIAQTLVANGFNLSFLNRREYGLDAIYNRYFEGETNHENQK